MPKLNIYTIPSSVSFVDTLAKGVLEKYGSDPYEFSNVTILLPNRRSCRALQEAFLRHSDRPMLLPAINPIGDFDEEEVILKSDINNFHELPPVISPTEQRLLLTKLIDKWKSTDGIGISQSAYLAVELASFLDEIQREQVSTDSFSELAPEEFAAHWQITLDFLKIIVDRWPEILSQKGKTDPALHRNAVLELKAQYWNDNPSSYPVIAAGSTGSIPATAKLLKMIASLEKGQVILPGLDKYIDKESWELLEESHPQFGLKHLLGFMKTSPDDVEIWNDIKIDSKGEGRIKIISEIMRPAVVSDKWQNIDELLKESLTGIKRFDLPVMQDEAHLIAIMMRKALEDKGRTAALVTSEKRLADMVSSIMQRWGVSLDNSSGYDLAKVPAAVFIRLVAQMALSKAAPVDLLSCFKHPLCAGGYKAVEFRNLARELEVTSLRGIRPQNDLKGIAKMLAGKGNKSLCKWFDKISNIIEPFVNLAKKKKVNFADILDIHLRTSQELCSTDKEDGALRLWGKDTGEQLKLFIDELLLSAVSLEEIEPADYLGIFDAMLIGRKYRPKYGAHPRLSILSPMEARVQHYDLVILGGLNEGIWPASINADPWMNRPMRSDAGLGLPEKRIGQSAHDFVQLFCSKEVVLTRSDKIDGTQTIPSRWLLRLDAVSKIVRAEQVLKPESYWFKWIDLMNAPESICAIGEPTPKPAREVRPDRLSVTNIEKLMRDPYSIYASKILKLKKLDDFDQEPGAREFGNFIHNSLDRFIKDYESITPENRHAKLLEYGRKEFDKMNLSESVNYFWWPRFERIADWFIENEESRHGNNIDIKTEISGQYQFSNGFILYAKADRVEFYKDSNAMIIDYKTGTVPTFTDMKLGFAPQMALEGLIAVNDGFGCKVKDVTQLEFWRLTGANPPAEIKDYNGEIPELISDADEGVKKLVEIFSDEKTAYTSCPDSKHAPRYNDFEHLARVREWENG